MKEGAPQKELLFTQDKDTNRYFVTTMEQLHPSLPKSKFVEVAAFDPERPRRYGFKRLKKTNLKHNKEYKKQQKEIKKQKKAAKEAQQMPK